MCGLFYGHSVSVTTALDYLHRRGPENFNEVIIDKEHFGHTLLHTRGQNTQQPAHNEHGYLLYNGSTYNSKHNDTKWLIQNLDNHLDNTISIIKNLIGEYALVYSTANHVVFCGDQWGTKNLWFYYSKENNHLLISSSKKLIENNIGSATLVKPNTIYIVNKKTFDLNFLKTTEWNLKQYVNNYDTVFEAFEQSVANRYEKDITTFTLSAGFDVGSINCCASKLFKKIHTVAKVGREHAPTLDARLKLHNGIVEYEEDSQWQSNADDMLAETATGYIKQKTARAITGIIQNHMLPQNKKIIIVGVGGDELYSDYNNTHEEGRFNKTNGLWPEDLQLVYPWHNYQNTNLRKQTMRNDIICGYNSVEARFPMLDQKLFQAWLNTKVTLKNKTYKDWMRQYMLDHNYPLYDDKKIGFTT